MLPAEVAHELTIRMLAIVGRSPLRHLFRKPRDQKTVKVLGITFPNAMGMAAGFDKNGDAIDGLAALGFGFIEVGTVTPEPQLGNAKPRLFRLIGQQAIINRMGFNNKGVDYLLEQVRRSRYQGVLGINIGKNKTTAEAEAVDDYLVCLEKVYPVADYVAVNLSSPNTPGLRKLQFGDLLANLLAALKAKQTQLDQRYKHKPLLIKIAPDLAAQDVIELAKTFNAHHVEGVIATNTTVAREQLTTVRYATEPGGLSGAPLRASADRVLQLMREHLHKDIALIGVGGVMSTADVERKLEMGADLVQLYSGLIYQGPGLIRSAIDCLAKAQDRS